MAQSARVNPLLQVLLLVALVEVGGFLALIFGPPLAALIQVLYANLVAVNTVSQPEERAFDLLLARLARLHTEADPDSRELASVLKRSQDLLDQARGMLDSGSQ
jgi:hypothetical protein